MAGRHVELREIDYAEVLRERKGGEAAAWDQVIANCLQGDAFELERGDDSGAPGRRRRPGEARRS